MGWVGRLSSAGVAVLVLAGAGGPAAGAEPGAAFADGSPEAVARVVEQVTTFPDVLDPRIWQDGQMKPDVRQAALQTVDRIVAEAGIDGLTVDAVDLFGSNASYEYDDAADFGVHVFVHSPGMSAAQLAPVLALLNDDVERRQEGRIRYYGIPAEVTFHAERSANYQPSPGIGQYSISESRWIVTPVRQPDNFDRAQMAADVTRFAARYNDLVGAYSAAPKGFDCGRFGALDAEMSAYRDAGFDAGLGSRSTANLTYRALRRLNVSVPDMVDALEDDCTFVHESVG